MSTKITKAEFDALPDSLKAKFEADGDGYSLQEIDVEGLKKSKAEILEEKKRIQAERDELKKFKDDHDAKANEADENQKRKAGEFEALEKKLRDKIAEVEADRDKRISDVRGRIFESSLENMLVAKGVRPEMARYARIDAVDQFELGDDYSLKLKDGIGDAKEVDGFISKLRESTPDFFKATTQPGGGASGSGNNGGNAKTMPEAQFDLLSPKEQAAFINSGGQPV